MPVFVIDVAEELQGLLGMNLFNSAAEFLYDPPLGKSTGNYLQTIQITVNLTGVAPGTTLAPIYIAPGRKDNGLARWPAASLGKNDSVTSAWEAASHVPQWVRKGGACV